MENILNGNKILNTFGKAPEEWKQFFITFKEIREEVLAKIFDLIKEKQDTYFQRIESKQKEAFSSVEDPSKYLAYHQSLASGTGPISSPKLDFDSNNSLLIFYQELLKEINNEKE